jgi:hypothetical protein
VLKTAIHSNNSSQTLTAALLSARVMAREVQVPNAMSLIVCLTPPMNPKDKKCKLIALIGWYEAAARSHTGMGIQLLHHSQVGVLLAAFLVQHDLGGHAHAA